MAGLNKYSDPQPYVNTYWNLQENEEGQSAYLPADVYLTHGSKSSQQFHSEQSDNEMILKKFIGSGVSIVSLIAENLLSHPFVVLRRQCQVHTRSDRHHIIPVTLVPIIYNLHKHQGITTLWKGLGSALMVRGMILGVEDLISKVTPLPKEITWHSSLKSFFQHIFLKSITLTIVMPFYCASLVETVQSDITTEKPGILDVFRAGAMRLFNWRGTAKGRMLPLWALVLPTVTLGIARYFFSLMVKAGAFRLMQVHHNQKQAITGTLPKKVSNIGLLQDMELNASLIAIVATDISFFPFETILHRLYLQGTRTIIDDLDTGKAVLPILSNYHGPVDCYESCLNNEGVFGFYKGFGALILQYAAHILVIRITRCVLTRLYTILYKSPKLPSNTSSILIANSIPTQNYLLS